MRAVKLALLIVLLSICHTAFASIASGSCGTGLTWTLNDDYALEIKGSGAMKDYSPSRAPWHNFKSSIVSVTIDSSVTHIGACAFQDCSSISSATIPNTVTSIGDQAFLHCSSLTSVTIPNSVTSIGNQAFYACSGLTSVTIPNAVTNIGDYAFYNCSGLTSVTIPNSVTNMGILAFSGCSKVKRVTHTMTDEADFANYLSRDDIGGVFYNGGLSGPEHIIEIQGQEVTSVTIPNSVPCIGNHAFRGCSRLTSVTIPNSVTSIGDCTFNNCSELTSVDIPSSITSIGDQAFYNCSVLTSAIGSAHWEIGKLLHDKKLESKHGSGVVNRLSYDLKQRYPQMGLSPRNLWDMKKFYERFCDSEPKLRQAVAVLPWGHTLTLMRKFGADDSAISYYAQETMSKGWNRELLSSAITLKMHLKKSESLDSNFEQTLPATQAMFANEVFKSGYNLGFLGVKDPILETELETRLVEKVKHFLLELGKGFTYLGNQYVLEYNGKRSKVDMLFFHRGLHCLVAIEDWRV